MNQTTTMTFSITKFYFNIQFTALNSWNWIGHVQSYKEEDKKRKSSTKDLNYDIKNNNNNIKKDQ